MTEILHQRTMLENTTLNRGCGGRSHTVLSNMPAPVQDFFHQQYHWSFQTMSSWTFSGLFHESFSLKSQLLSSDAFSEATLGSWGCHRECADGLGLCLLVQTGLGVLEIVNQIPGAKKHYTKSFWFSLLKKIFGYFLSL